MVLISLFHISSQGNKALYKPCATWRGEFEEAVAVFLCNDGDGHRLVVNFIPDQLSLQVTLQQGCFQLYLFVMYCDLHCHFQKFEYFSLRGEFVYIRDDREQQEYFGLCEVQVGTSILIIVRGCS